MRRDHHSFSRVSSAAFLVALLIFILSAIGFGQTTTRPADENLIRRSDAAPVMRGTTKLRTDTLDVPRVGISLLVVIALIYATRLTLRKLSRSASGTTSSRAVHVLARNAISPKQQVLVLQVGRRLIVV